MNAPNLLRDSFPAPCEIVIDDPLAALTPSQQTTLAEIERISAASPIVGLVGANGLGKSTIMRALIQKSGAATLDTARLIKAMTLRAAEAGTRAALREFERLLDETDLLVVDDLEQLIRAPSAGDGSGNTKLGSQMPNLVFDMVRSKGKRLIFTAHREWDLSAAGSKWQRVTLHPFEAADYRQIVSNRLGNAALSTIDVDVIHQAAGGLNGYDLSLVCTVLGDQEAPDTGAMMDALQANVLFANVRTERVEGLSFDSLPGAEHIAEKLETHIVMPLENPELAKKLDIRPKRGVLLYGPPGTGKTSIGRALAHRMKGKFFLIDGSFTTEPPSAFFDRVTKVVQDALANAPCVIFVDDADVLFGIVHISGFARYLLSLLDGMESESVGKVCLMMTAMDASKVPSAILRSGRVELWLETRSPSTEVRAAILKRWMNAELPGAADIDYTAVAERATNFTPADLRRVVADAMAYFAVDDVAGRPLSTGDEYLVRAVDALIATRDRMAALLHDDSLRLEHSGPGKYGTSIGGLVEVSTSCAVTGW